LLTGISVMGCPFEKLVVVLLALLRSLHSLGTIRTRKNFLKEYTGNLHSSFPCFYNSVFISLIVVRPFQSLCKLKKLI